MRYILLVICVIAAAGCSSTCVELGGNPCGSYQECPGSFIPAKDHSRCCDTDCVTMSFEEPEDQSTEDEQSMDDTSDPPSPETNPEAPDGEGMMDEPADEDSIIYRSISPERIARLDHPPEFAERPPVRGGYRIAPPPDGFYFGIQEAAIGDTALFEAQLGRKATLLWPYPVLENDQRLDEMTSFNVEQANIAFEAGYLFMIHLSPDPAEGLLVDDILRGAYDEHLQRLSSQMKEFGKPFFLSVYDQPNDLSDIYKGGYGPLGDKDLHWAENDGSLGGHFDPQELPDPSLYEGLGSYPDDGLARLAALQRYYHDFFVVKNGISTISFDTMGWLVMPGTNSLLDPAELFLSFYFQIEDTVDWISFNFPTIYSTSAETSLGENLVVLDDHIMAIRNRGIQKPILFRLSLCGEDRSELAFPVITRMLEYYPEISAVVLLDQEAGEQSCRLTQQTYQEISRAVSVGDRFHSCPFFSDSSVVPTCDVLPYGGFPQSE